ncbi:MAG: hypothetical protein ACI4F7_06010 [Acutalibacteraceae bacterium]
MKKQLKRILATVLSLTVLASVWVMVAVTAAENIEIANYPALRGFSSGSAPADGKWSYGVADYGMKSPLTASSADFAAPNAAWDADNTQATLSWDSYEGAEKYVLNFYLNSVLSFSKESDGTSFVSTTTQDEIKGGEIYEVQVLAKDSTDNVIAASKVRRFPTTEDANSLRTVEDFSETDDSIFSLKSNINDYKITDTGTAYMNPNTGSASSNRTMAMKINAEDATGRAEAIVIKVKHAPNTVCAVNVDFGVSANTTGKSSGNVYKKSTATANWYSDASDAAITFVSVKDPSSQLEIESKPTYAYTANAEYAKTLASFTDGYYMIIPLSAYSTAVKTDLKAGTFDLIRFKFIRAYSTDGDGLFSNTGFIKDTTYLEIDQVALCDNIEGFIYELEYGYDSTYSFKDGNVTTVMPTVFDSGNDLMYCDEANTGYKLSNDSSSRKITFTARSYHTALYGVYMSFCAPEKGFYDLSSALQVINNSSAQGEIHYRLVRIADGGDTQETVYPYGDEEWKILEISDVNRNPEAKLTSPTVELLKGEELIIEAYYESGDGDNEVELLLGNPTVNKVERTDNYKGENTVWSFGNYVPHFIYDGAVSNLQGMYGRWSADAIKINESGTVNRLVLDNYSGNFVKNSASGAGYHYYSNTDRTDEMKIAIGNNYGLSFDFTSPVDGNITVSMAYNADDTAKYRILKNGTVVYPENGGWQHALTGDVAVYTQISVQKGDEVSLQTYSSADSVKEYAMPTAPSISLSIIGSIANVASDTTYAPLWERPWNGRSYEGIFSEYSGSLWSFNTIDVNTSGSKITVHDADYFSTEDNTLAASDSAVSGSFYRFDSESLSFNCAAPTSGYNGMSLTFNVPADANYDLSTGIRVAEGGGKIYIRVLYAGASDSQHIYPKDGWSITDASKGDVIDFVPIEIKASAGETITLQVYARSNEEKSPVTIAFDQLAVQRLDNKFFTATVYNPIDYAIIEPSYEGSIAFGSGRFEYSTTDTSGNTYPITRISAQQNAYFTDEGSAFLFEGGAFGIKLVSGSTASVLFNAPSSGGATVNIKPADTAELRLLQNGNIIANWCSELVNIAIIATENDEFTVEIRGCESLSFDAFGFEIIGRNNNQGSDSDTAYYAVFGEPYDEDYKEYKGKYIEDALSYWRYYLYDVNASNIVKTEYYDAVAHKLSLNENRGLGYTFTTHNLMTDISEEYGLSLGFTSPRDDTFNFRTGLVIETQNVTATLNVRLIKVSGTEGTVTTVWPAEGGWHNETVSTGEEINIPYAEFNLKKGDDIRFEVYATDSTEGEFKLNLVSPAAIQDVVTSLSSGECSARIFYAASYSPYKYFKSYSGNYIPMENRWNFEFFEADGYLDSTNTFLPTFFSTGNYNELIYKGINSWPAYKFSGTNLATYPTRQKSTNESVGTSAQFVSPINGSIAITGAPTLKTVMPVERSGVAFRIRMIKADSGEVTTLWPANGEGWEKLSNENALSMLQDITADVSVGDEIRFETYIYADDESAMSEYTQSNNLKATVEMTAAIIVYDSIETEKSNWSALSGFMPNLQISPLWKIQYSNDADNPIWKNATRFSWNYWLSNENSYMGISSGCRMWIQNHNGSLDNLDIPSVAYAYYPQNDGWLIMGSSNKSTLQSVKSASETMTGLVRVTVNGENVYPAGGGWLEAKSATFGGLEIEVKKGDTVRFEMTTNEHLSSGEEVYVYWNPSFTYQKYKNIYSETTDIYNMLDEDMLKYFMALSGSNGFDTDPETGKAISEAAIARKKQALLDAMNEENTGSNIQNSSSINQSGSNTVYIPGTYEEWTEDIYTPGGGYRKIIRTYYTEWWVYALIIGGVVLVLSGIVITLVILKKRGKLFVKKTNRSKIAGGS